MILSRVAAHCAKHRMPPQVACLPLKSATLPPATHTNCYLLGDAQTLVVDPGSDFPRERRRLRRALYQLLGSGGTLQAIVLTHHHRDHVADAERLARDFQLPVWAHQRTLSRLRLRQVATRSLMPQQRIFCGKLAVDIMHTPGHAPGHLCLQFATVMIGGDNVPGVGTTLIAPSDGDMIAYLASLRAMRAAKPSWLLPAHGPPIVSNVAAAIDAMLQHRLARERKILDALRALDRPAGAASIAELAYRGELSRAAFGLAVASTVSHLKKLVTDGAAQHLGGGAYLATVTRDLTGDVRKA